MHFTRAQVTVMYVHRLETDVGHPWLLPTLLTEAGSLHLELTTPSSLSVQLVPGARILCLLSAGLTYR